MWRPPSPTGPRRQARPEPGPAPSPIATQPPGRPGRQHVAVTSPPAAAERHRHRRHSTARCRRKPARGRRRRCRPYGSLPSQARPWLPSPMPLRSLAAVPSPPDAAARCCRQPACGRRSSPSPVPPRPLAAVASPLVGADRRRRRCCPDRSLPSPARLRPRIAVAAPAARCRRQPACGHRRRCRARSLVAVAGPPAIVAVAGPAGGRQGRATAVSTPSSGAGTRAGSSASTSRRA